MGAPNLSRVRCVPFVEGSTKVLKAGADGKVVWKENTFEAIYRDNRERFVGRLAEGDDSVMDEMCAYLLVIAPYVKAFCEEVTLDAENDDFLTHNFAQVTSTSKWGQGLRAVHGRSRKRPRLAGAHRTDRGALVHRLQLRYELAVFRVGGMPVMRSISHNEAYQRDDSRALSYKEEQEQTVSTNQFAYKRANHFADRLRSLDTTTAVDLPSHVVDTVRYELKKLRITDVRDHPQF